ncbi:unnamed protein product [Nezara viridula]|uniref:Leucine-rich repeat-containing protein 58 n=1 Tax=Nezara viridula TaxID=85310 RepID=A0A9P0E0T0_NEZVI|nr:unnamed protein product [Nezara viridula]
MELYSSESSDSDGFPSMKTVDYSYMMITNQILKKNIEALEQEKQRDRKPDVVQKLHVNNNQLTELPQNLSHFHNLRHIDVSNNRLRSIPETLTRFPLVTLNAKNNLITNDNLPKSFQPWASTLLKLNLGGNSLTHFPPQVLDVLQLKSLYLGSNHIEELPRNINKLSSLSLLCVGGNRLIEVPDSVGELNNLEVLIVSDNKLENLPPSIASLKKLKTLQLHKNRLRTLPTEIIKLKCLSELSLRDNPLVVKFVNDMTYNPATLLEIAARVVKVNEITHTPEDLPRCLREYLNSAHYCVNPRCNGVFFDNRVEHIKFVDFCGKYRVPLLQYLCSSKCVVDNSALREGGGHSYRTDIMRKVLLG